MRNLFLFFSFMAMANVFFGQENKFYSEGELASHSAFLEATVEKYKGNDTKAIDLFKQTLKKDDSNHTAAFEIAKLFKKVNNSEEAIRYGEKALSKASTNHTYLSFLANAEMDAQNFPKAISYLQTLKTANPREEEYYVNMAHSYMQDNKSKEAIDILNELEAIIGVTESITKRKYEIHKFNDDKDLAQLELIKLSDANPTNTDYLNNLAKFFSKTNQPEKAKATYKKILALDPDDTHANLAMASELNDKNNASAYLLSLKNVLENREIAIDAKIKELIPHIENVHPSSDSILIRSIDQSLNSLRLSHPKSAKAVAISGDFYSKLKKDDLAISYYEKTLKINDNIFSVWEQLLFLYEAKGNDEKLLSASETALDLFPNQTNAYLFYAKALIRLNRKDDALDILNEAKLVAGKNDVFLKQIEQITNSIK